MRAGAGQRNNGGLVTSLVSAPRNLKRKPMSINNGNGLVKSPRLASERADRIREHLQSIRTEYTALCTELRAAIAEQDWRALGYRNPDEYIYQEFAITPAWGYALARVEEMKSQFPELSAPLDALDISKATTVVSAFPQDRKTRVFDATVHAVGGLIDIAKSATLRGLRDTVREQNGGYAGTGEIQECPYCHERLHLSRAAQITKA